MRLVLMGTNDFVVPIFERLKIEHEILAVFTRAPKPAGRSMQLQKSPVHLWAESKNLPVYTNINQLTIKQITNIDFIVVVSYGVILRDDVLNVAPCINIHPSDLPLYRGPSPMQTAILNGDTKSAVCLIKMTADVDAGDIFIKRDFEIGENDTIDDVEKKVSKIGGEILSDYLASPKNYPPQPQTGEPSFTHKFDKADHDINWSKSPIEIHNTIRALGFGRTKINGADVKILETKVADDKLEILYVQPAGKKAMDWADFVNGQRGKINLGE